MAKNMDTYNELKTVPDTAKTPITGGRLKGKTDISPQWRIEKMTETFGICGVGWKFTIDKQWTEKGSFDQLMCFVDISLYIKVEKTWDDKPDIEMVWSHPIPGTGGNMLITKEKAGLHSSDEGYKMALTDALSVAMKFLGMGADVYMGFDGGKYSNQTDRLEMPDAEKATKSQMEYIVSLLAQKQLGEDVVFKEFGIKSLDDIGVEMARMAIKFLSTHKTKGVTSERVMCPNTEKYVLGSQCADCDHRKGCPAYDEDVKI